MYNMGMGVQQSIANVTIIPSKKERTPNPESKETNPKLRSLGAPDLHAQFVGERFHVHLCRPLINVNKHGSVELEAYQSHA